MAKKVTIIGAGPAGLACAYYLTKNSEKNIKDLEIYEATNNIGGISRTINKKGFRFDLGGHRFFTKNDEINKLFNEVVGKDVLKVKRYTPIYFRKKYFDYPIKISNVMKNLGPMTSARIIFDYIYIRIANFIVPRKDKTFEDWVTNRFGKSLFNFFFKSYTEKLWGIPTNKIGAEFAAQRIKGMSIGVVIKNALIVNPKNRPKTLIDSFKYPKLGIGQFYEKMADQIGKNKIVLNNKIEKINTKNNRVESIVIKTPQSTKTLKVDDLVSSMPITDLVNNLNPKAPKKVIDAANKLEYRATIFAVLLINKPHVSNFTWVYVHEPNATIGRFTEPKNWSKYLVKDPKKSSIVSEMWSFENEALWNKSDKELVSIAESDLVDKMGFVKQKDIIETIIIKEPKTYPTYKNGYEKHLKIVNDYLSKFKNLHLIGRYGTFRYNNMDHSIETGFLTAKNIIAGKKVYDITQVNSEAEYHEEKK
jgi:protoporphyrinogen oxidase